MFQQYEELICKKKKKKKRCDSNQENNLQINENMTKIQNLFLSNTSEHLTLRGTRVCVRELLFWAVSAKEAACSLLQDSDTSPELLPAFERYIQHLKKQHTVPTRNPLWGLRACEGEIWVLFLSRWNVWLQITVHFSPSRHLDGRIPAWAQTTRKYSAVLKHL